MLVQLVHLAVATVMTLAGTHRADSGKTIDKSEESGKEGAYALLKSFGLEWPNNPTAYKDLPAPARYAIEDSFARTMEGKTMVLVQGGKKVEVTLGDFATETGDGTELSCEFGPDAVGCWHDGKFTGCYSVFDGEDYECVWNEGIGDNDD